MKIKKIFKNLNVFKKKLNEKLTIGDYKIKLKWIRNQKDPNLQDGNKFFSRKD
jgi:hypothetical protein